MPIQELKKVSGGFQKPIVLLIEDDKFLGGLLVQKLEKENFEAQIAVSAVDAFKLIEIEKPDVVLLDLVLPGMDGFQMIKEMKKNPQLSEIPVIALTNLSQKDDIDRAFASGAADYLIKSSSTPGEIVEKIRNILSQKVTT
ncbi:MAG: response regulator [Candidatus Tagabacteria bacterium CG_4_10_14_0_2_um_filter_40_13]|uniref:Response regulator n=2 Tax=Candidatus Tagaibacteriota TaxID=1817918 RepID=A0A2M7B9D4_9BACT|nr:MAG: response regulator [Candidatus Tagabacteria bacterium CG11_big_fil_rev_8_21_14_0_20_41_11]PIU99732.1 MAG: response regulator [Candidatus Tagabacteria bacterium CG03_land_8_20_14_0_80_41_22]PIZ56145.1 MAG: response regulator [Candidatus Tagabacteria bacterium CG_4_10_14_0_2_um_filter_40_13]PJC25093.1 MAG: response regulator [Candidatus Tagabacteria bacterium CG_4_9_14_0_2_um_filter_41_11]